MPCHTPRLFARLRRYRGVWVLALAVLLFKVAMSTFCVLDGPRVACGGNVAVDNVVASAAADSGGDTDYCVLGEGSRCHCACDHTAALPSGDDAVTVSVALLRVHALPDDSPSPAFLRVPHRPPIA
ncbi:hypothetical protein [Luteibacter sp.]|jgi:hypothetical protein|uniref:hypothetical protein n=1 Tax=Luteibacter sp. TaxID=1886636 RepID=UPI002F3EFC99